MSYMVFVQGKQPPVKKHDFLVDAEAEVERLAQMPDNRMSKIYILEIKKVNEPVITRRWTE